MPVNQSLVQKLTRTKPAPVETDAGTSLHGEGLSRSIGLFSLTMIGVGATIGTGIFFTMVEAVPKAGPSVVLSFLLAALTAGLTALCYAELSFRVPAAGSAYSFAYRTLGEFMAFIVAFCLLLEYGLAASATAIGWSDYLNNFLINAFHWQIPEYMRSPMIVSTPEGTVWNTSHFNLPPMILVFGAAKAQCRFCISDPPAPQACVAMLSNMPATFMNSARPPRNDASGWATPKLPCSAKTRHS